MTASFTNEESRSSLVFVRDSSNEDSVEIESSSENDEETSQELFIPSNMWQKIRPGQAVPSGLHYRINLATGEKEAKLLDENHSSGHAETSESDVNSKDSFWQDSTGKFNFLDDAELTEKLSKLPDDGPKEEREVDLSQYRKIDELMKDFEAMNQHFQTESEIVETLTLSTKNLTNSTDVEQLLVHLEDIEYYTHQIDNAQDFLMRYDGLNLMRSLLGHESYSVQQAALKVLTSCLQGTQQLKVFAVRQGQGWLIHHLVKLLDQKDSEVEPSVNFGLKKSTLYTLSSLLRNFPHAQLRFIEQNGFQVLCSSALQYEVPLHRVLQLTSDLMEEYNDHLSQLNPDSADIAKQYSALNLPNRVGCVCDVATLALRNVPDSLVVVASIAHSLENLLPVCAQSYLPKWTSYVTILTDEFRKDEPLWGKDNDPEFTAEVLAKVDSILNAMKSLHSIAKTEL